MVVPAAGRGSRLGSALPKVVVPVNGRAMIDYILARYSSLVDRFVIVVSPEALAIVRSHCLATGFPIELAIQESPTGMLDAILVPARSQALKSADQVWITWCDQIAVSQATAERLAKMLDQSSAELAMPTLTGINPYIHFERDTEGRITRVLQRREGDPMPEVGESDIGLFGLSGTAYRDLLPRFAETAPVGTSTRERNFLPFIPWLAAQGPIQTFPAVDPMEAIGINTVEDLGRVAAFLSRGA
jgi:bifunctional N-acetylglucosamine-1-phosphate-uridyltransferase/glucosamine-1-phosphate-acetyltransferase GlmU-like protein